MSITVSVYIQSSNKEDTVPRIKNMKKITMLKVNNNLAKNNRPILQIPNSSSNYSLLKVKLIIIKKGVKKADQDDLLKPLSHLILYSFHSCYFILVQ